MENRRNGNKVQKNQRGHSWIHKIMLVIGIAMLAEGEILGLRESIEGRKIWEQCRDSPSMEMQEKFASAMEPGGLEENGASAEIRPEKEGGAGDESEAELQGGLKPESPSKTESESWAEARPALQVCRKPGRLRPEPQAGSPSLFPGDFEELSEINPDTAGWIYIPGTTIDYPIVQGNDNETYLYKSFEGEEAAGGSIFLDFESQRDFRGYHSILYGHHMKDGSMFRDVVFYEEEDYFKAHPYFEIYTPQKTIHLKAAACYHMQNDPLVRKTSFRSRESFQDFVRKMLEPCPYAEIPEEPMERLYTLVTCSYEVEDGRTVLFAVETDEYISNPQKKPAAPRHS